MARNRKNEPAAIRFGTAVKALLTCGVIVSACLVYVWEKQQINDLGQAKGRREAQRRQLQEQNDKFRRQLAEQTSLPALEQRLRELNLGLVPTRPGQVWTLPEPAADGPLPGDSQYAAGRLAGSSMQ